MNRCMLYEPTLLWFRHADPMHKSVSFGPSLPKPYGQSRKVGKCVPAHLVLKPNLPTFRSGQSGTPHGFQKEQASECDLPSLLPLANTIFPRSALRKPASRKRPPRTPARPDPWFVWIVRSCVPALEENTFPVGPRTASTWGKAIPPCH